MSDENIAVQLLKGGHKITRYNQYSHDPGYSLHWFELDGKQLSDNDEIVAAIWDAYMDDLIDYATLETIDPISDREIFTLTPPPN